MSLAITKYRTSPTFDGDPWLTVAMIEDGAGKLGILRIAYVFCAKNRDASSRLYLIWARWPSVMFYEYWSEDIWCRSHIETSIRFYERPCFIEFHAFSDDRVSGLGSDNSRLKPIFFLFSWTILHSSEKFQLVQFIKPLEHHHIAVQIDTTVMVERIKAQVIRNESIFLISQSFFNVLNAVKIERGGIPKFYLIIWETLFPSLDTIFYKGWVFITWKPTEMYDFGYHAFVGCVVFSIRMKNYLALIRM